MDIDERMEKIAAAEEDAKASIEIERIKNEKRLKKIELKLEADRAKRIANETAEQREARLSEEKRVKKKKEEEDRRHSLLSNDIYIAINKPLAEFANDRRKFDDAKMIIEYINEMTFILEKFILSEDKSGKYRLIANMNLSLLRYQSVLSMLNSIDPLNPLCGEFEANLNNYKSQLLRAEKSARAYKRNTDIRKKLLLIMRMIVVGVFIAIFFVDNNIMTMGCWTIVCWWIIYEFKSRKKRIL